LKVLADEVNKLEDAVDGLIGSGFIQEDRVPVVIF
jgi:hypothetical protein